MWKSIFFEVAEYIFPVHILCDMSRYMAYRLLWLWLTKSINVTVHAIYFTLARKLHTRARHLVVFRRRNMIMCLMRTNYTLSNIHNLIASSTHFYIDRCCAGTFFLLTCAQMPTPSVHIVFFFSLLILTRNFV